MARLLEILTFVMIAACNAAPTPPPEPRLEQNREAIEPRIEEAAPAVPPSLRAGEEIAVPTGIVHVGTRPGSPHRRAAREAALVAVEVPAFSIDRLPYPNDPTAPELTNVTYAEASSLCETAGKRLCTELEWERACKSDTQQPFAAGDRLHIERCGLATDSCASPLAVISMGTRIEEWTSSDPEWIDERGYRTIRGAAASAPLSDHRCGARRAASDEQTSESRGFRCCRGEVAPVDYPAIETRPTFSSIELDNTEAQRILASIPALARFADGFRLFQTSDEDRALSAGVLSRDDLGTHWQTLQGRGLLWSPTAGEEVLIFAGATATSSLLVGVHPMGSSRYTHGASFILDGETSPIAVLFTAGTPELLWTACYGCDGDGGAIYRRDEDSRIVIVQR